MKKMILTSAAVAMALGTMSTPAFAAIDSLGTQPELDALCDALLTANDNSGFTTYALTGVPGTPSVVTTDDGATVFAGIGAATSTLGNYRTPHVNGLSVNIHALGDYVTTYAGGHTETTPTKTVTTVTTSATCHVHKPTPAGDHASDNANNDKDPLHDGYNVAPPGLQVTGPVSVTSTTTTYSSRVVTDLSPWVDLSASTYGGEFVICISPTKNPGVWRGANGYPVGGLGAPMLACSTTWHNNLMAPATSPSVSLPPA